MHSLSGPDLHPAVVMQLSSVWHRAVIQILHQGLNCLLLRPTPKASFSGKVNGDLSGTADINDGPVACSGRCRRGQTTVPFI